MNKKVIKYLLIVLFLLVGLFGLYQQSRSSDNLAEIIFFDIGQGDSIMIITPDKQKILIDGGPGNYLISQIGRYLPFYDQTIDIMISTHAHDDHVSGLVEILKRYPVNLILYPGRIDYRASSYLEWLRIVQIKSLNLQATHSGNIYKFNNSTLTILYPFEIFHGQKIDDVNSSSVVSRYCYIQVCVLLTGDMTANVERQLLLSDQDVKAQILKVSHHGSQYSSTDDFLQAVNPKTVIIQSGTGNRYNHPHLRILKKFKRLGMKVLRNDLLGEITIQTDGYNYWLKQ